MTSAVTFYTKLLTKRPDITGTKDQAFGHKKNFLNYLVGAIRAKTVAAIGMVAPGNLLVQYLCAPKVHTDLAGKPLATVGNTSNKFGEFSLAMIPLSSVKMFISIVERDDNVHLLNLIEHGDDITNDFRKDTKWHDSTATHVGTVLPNMFLIYFGQDVPLGPVTSDDTKLAFERLGTGYETWSIMAGVALEHLDDIDVVVENASNNNNRNEFKEFAKKYLCYDLASAGIKATRTGPCLSVTLVQSDDYPVLAAEIKCEFNPLSASGPLPGVTTMTIQHPSKVGRDAEATKGMSKLLLFCLCGDVNLNNGTIGNVTYATPSQGMAIVMANPRSARAQHFTDLLRSSLAIAKRTDPNNIRSRELSMTHTSKSMASHFLLGNLSLDGVTSLYNEAHSIDPTAFLPQRDQAAIASERARDLSTRIEDDLDVLETHRKKTATTISRIGTLLSVRDVTSLCININTIILAITSSTSPQPIIYQLLAKIIDLTVNCDYGEWENQCGSSMPNLHLKLFSYIDMMWVNIARAASDFRNVNVITELQPIANLDMSNYVRAVTVIKALVSEITIAQSQGAPLIVPRSIITKYFPTAALGQEKTPAAAATSTPRNANAKRDQTTPDGGTPKEPSQHQKKKRQTPGVERPAFNMKNMGMFYLKNPAMLKGAVFPKELSKTICVPYVCKELECTKENCPNAHPRNASDIDLSDVEKIAVHFKMNKHGHLSEYHFCKLKNASKTVKSVWGGAGGITSSKTN